MSKPFVSTVDDVALAALSITVMLETIVRSVDAQEAARPWPTCDQLGRILGKAAKGGGDW